MKLHQLEKSKWFKDKARRLGRWNASKWNYSGKWLKGQKARSGRSVRPFFEWGQTPVVMRMPKARGFKRCDKWIDKYTIINVSALEKDPSFTTEVTKNVLKEAGYIKSISDMVKILWNWDLKKSLSFVWIEKFTKSAVEKIEKAGGKIS